PVQVDSAERLRKLLNIASGGAVLTPARPRVVGLRPALRAVYVARRPSLSIHHDAEVHAGGERREAPGLERSYGRAHFQTHSRSKIVAKPWPTPTQSDAMPREAPVRAIWWISVVARRAPLQPSG